jgi:hypothetical protein
MQYWDMANFLLLSKILIDRMAFAETDGTSDYYKDVTNYQLRMENKRTKSEVPYLVQCQRDTKEESRQCVLKIPVFVPRRAFSRHDMNLLCGSEETR